MMSTITARCIQIKADNIVLRGNLTLPTGAVGLVLFAHGSGSSRFSPRNQFVAGQLNTAGLATLLIDLLTETEERIDRQTSNLRFDLPFLARRLCTAVDWLSEEGETRQLPIGLFGASTGGGAAIMAAAQQPARVKAVVSRGGRPDLAGSALRRSVCPTLLIVGGLDRVVIELNREAFAQLGGESNELIVVPGAGHLFEEPGALPEVARLAVDWFTRHLKFEGFT